MSALFIIDEVRLFSLGSNLGKYCTLSQILFLVIYKGTFWGDLKNHYLVPAQRAVQHILLWMIIIANGREHCCLAIMLQH